MIYVYILRGVCHTRGHVVYMQNMRLAGRASQNASKVSCLRSPSYQGVACEKPRASTGTKASLAYAPNNAATGLLAEPAENQAPEQSRNESENGNQATRVACERDRYEFGVKSDLQRPKRQLRLLRQAC